MGVAESLCLLGVVVPGLFLALRRCGKGLSGDYSPQGPSRSRAQPAPALLRLPGWWVLDCGDLSRMFTLSSGCQSENCRIFSFRFTCFPFHSVPRTFKKPTVKQLPRLTLTLSWKCPVAVVKSGGYLDTLVLHATFCRQGPGIGFGRCPAERGACVLLWRGAARCGPSSFVLVTALRLGSRRLGRGQG